MKPFKVFFRVTEIWLIIFAPIFGLKDYIFGSRWKSNTRRNQNPNPNPNQNQNANAANVDDNNANPNPPNANQNANQNANGNPDNANGADPTAYKKPTYFAARVSH